MSGLAPYIDKDHINFYKLSTKIIVSLVVLFACGVVVFFSEASENDKRLAAGFLGTTIGYWIK